MQRDVQRSPVCIASRSAHLCTRASPTVTLLSSEYLALRLTTQPITLHNMAWCGTECLQDDVGMVFAATRSLAGLRR